MNRRKFLKASACAAIVASGTGIALQATATEGVHPIMESFPLYRAAGSHRELGRQHGAQAARQIASHLQYLCDSLQLTREELRRRSATFERLFRQYCPHLLEEIEGLAEGAKIDYADALAVNIRSALGKALDGGCTAFVVAKNGTADGQILIGQNSDQLPIGLQLAYVLHLKPTGKPEILMWTFGGMIGYHGINSLGVAHFANDLGGGPAPRFGMPHYLAKRLMHECASLAEVEQLMKRTSWWASGNYILCDGHGEILDIEATPEGLHAIRDNGRGFIAHTNHFLCARYATAENYAQSAADSFSRLNRIDELIQTRFGKLSVADFQSFLRDRQNDPNGICRIAQTDQPHADWRTAGITVASIIAEPARRCLHIAAGNRTDAKFETYRMD